MSIKFSRNIEKNFDSNEEFSGKFWRTSQKVKTNFKDILEKLKKNL